MTLKALVYAYVLGGVTFLPLLICAAIAWTIYTSVPVGDPDPSKLERKKLAEEGVDDKNDDDVSVSIPTNDQVRPRKAWLTVRRTFEERETDVSYVNMMRTFLDSRSKDPKRSRPKDMWYVVLKGRVMYLYEDEAMTDCEAAIQVPSHEVVVYPEGLQDGELFTKRNAICLKPLEVSPIELNSVTKQMELEDVDVDKEMEDVSGSQKKRLQEKERLMELEKLKVESRTEAFDLSRPWFIFVRSCVEMEDWYMALVHAANYSEMSTLEPVLPVFRPSDMQHLVSTLDDQPDVIPMRWLNALIGRIFFSFYRTQHLEKFIIGRLMKKISKVKTPAFLQNIVVTDVSVGNTPPTLSKPMLKELTQEGDMSLEVRLMYKGEIRLTVEATAIINLGQRFKTYSVKLVLAVVLRKIDGNLLVKIKRPPTNRIWYAFTQAPEMVLNVEPVVSDRQIKWSMILSTIESRIKEVIAESVVLPNMDDIAFFDSDEFLHRGGIWADAKKKERSVPGVVDDQPSGGNDEADVIKKSKSTDGVTDLANDLPEPDVVNRAVTVDGSHSSDTSKRKSWFSNSNSGNTLAVPESESGLAEAEVAATGEMERGRSTESSTTESSGRRAVSVPATTLSSSSGQSGSISREDAAGEGTTTQSNQTDLDSDDSLNPSSPRVRSLSSGASLGAADASLFSATLSSRDTTPSTTRTNTTASTTSSSTTTSSFLSALRSKADKQTLNNAAKEAMRKWNMNWKGFKAEHGGGGGGAGRQSPNSNSGDETADMGGVQTESSGSSLLSFPSKRPNYSDLRAAVAGRKDRERAVSSDRAAVSSSSTAPIDIPGKNKADELREGNSNPSTPPNREADHELPSSQTASSPKGPSLLRHDSARASASPPKLTTQTSSIGSMHVMDTPDTPPTLIQAQPIKTQPSQGASMTIPGIHASHRNEVMSLGYAPPPAVTPAAPSPSDAKLLTPTIQSMYRLFKTPTGSGPSLQQQQQDASFSPARSPPGSSRNSIDENHEREVLDGGADEHSAPSSSSLVVPMKAPPLPPRRPSVSLDSSSPSPHRTLPSSPVPPDTSNSVAGGSSLASHTRTHSAASHALKHIAEQDSSLRRTREGGAEQQQRTSVSHSKKRHSLGAKRITTPLPTADLFTDHEETTAPNYADANPSVTVIDTEPTELRPGPGAPKEADEKASAENEEARGDVFGGSSSPGSRGYGDATTYSQVNGSNASSGGTSTPEGMTELPAQRTEKPIPPPLPPRRL